MPDPQDRRGDVVRINVLGPWEVHDGRAPVAVPPGRLAVLLASLLLSLDEPVSVETLTERLWPDRAPVGPREAVHVYVTRLRKLLGKDVIETAPGGGYRLRVLPENVDLHQFRALVARAGSAGSADREGELLREALRLWRGKPFGNLPSTWLDRDVMPGLVEEWLAAVERRIDLDLSAGPAGSTGPLIAELRALTNLYPLRESLWFRLVRALYDAGQRADALDAFEQARAVLKTELGVVPGEQLTRLWHTLTQAPSASAPAATASTAAPLIAQAPAASPASGPAGTDRTPAVLSASLGDQLRAYRIRLSLTQAELAEQAGISERTIHGLETGRTSPRASTTRMLATALGLDAEESKLFLAAVNRPAPPPSQAPAEPAPAAPAPTVPAQLPPDVRDFVGRVGEFAALDASLPVTGDTAVVVLAGPAGVGKTALATRWAHRVAGQFPDGQLHANLRGFAPGPPVPPIEVLADFLEALGTPAGRIPAKPDAAAALYRSALAGRRMLIVLDNALDADQVRPLLPSGTGSLVLVTSRTILSGLLVSHGARQLPVHPLTAAEGLELVTQVVGAGRVAAEQDATADLVAECAGLPLALRIAAAQLRVDDHLDIGGYVTDLRTGDRFASLEVADDATTSVGAAFDWSYDRLAVQDQRLFRQLGLVPGPDLTPEAAAALTATDPRQAERRLRALADAHLLDRPSRRRYALHDLLRAYASERTLAVDSEPVRDASTDRLVRWYLHSTVAAIDVLSPTILRLPAPAPPSEDELAIVRPPDVTAAREWLAAERHNLVAAVTHAADSGRHEAAWLLADALRSWFETTGNRIDWITVAQAALAAATAEGDRAAQSAVHSSLAHVRHIGGEFDAANEHATSSLQLARQAGWLRGEARAYNHLAVLAADADDLPRCVELLAAALELDRRAGDRVGEGKRLLNLGVATQLLGRLTEALDYMQQAVDRLGPDVHDDTTLANIGHLQHHTGDLAAAEETLNRAIALQADNAVQRALSLVHLTELCLDRGRLAEADAHAEAAVTIAGETGDQERAFQAVDMRAYVDVRLGRPGAAAEKLEELLRQIGDQGYLGIRCYALAGLAEALRDLGRPDEAWQAADQAVKLAEAAGRPLLESETRVVRAETRLARYRRDGDRSELREASADIERALDWHRKMGLRVAEARVLIVFGDIREADGDPIAATGRWRAALDLCTELGLPADIRAARARLAGNA